MSHEASPAARRINDLPDDFILKGRGLLLRAWSDDDAPALRPVCGDPAYCRFTSIPREYTPELALAWVRRQRARRAAGESILFAITAAGESDSPLGSVNLTGLSADGRAAGLGYWLLPEARGSGLATAAAATLCRFGFDRLGLERIELAILPENRASQRVAERLGARAEGLHAGARVDAGRAWDMEIYSLSAPPPMSAPPAAPSPGRP